MKYRPFGRAAKDGPEQLDLFAVVPDFVLRPGEEERSGLLRWPAYWKDKFAGDIWEMEDGRVQSWVNKGFVLTGPGGGGGHSEYLGEFDTLDAATATLEKRTIEVRADPTLIWTLEKTKENIAKAKAKGWWKKEKAA